jgi:hypothetical protein
MAKTPPKHTDLANKLAQEKDADIFLYNGDIARHYDRTLAELCRKQNRRTNLILLLVTQGGDPDAAYRIARCFQGEAEACCSNIRAKSFATGHPAFR